MFRAPSSGFLRIPFVQRCEVEIGAERRPGLTCNLSLLGVYVHLAEPFEAGREISVRFHLPDGGAPILASAVVTWSNQDPPARVVDLPVGCGLRFSGLAPEERARVERLVIAFARDPEPAVGLSQPRSGRLRVPFVATATLLTGAGVAQGTVCNLSESGVYVATTVSFAPEERLVVSFALPGHAGGAFARRARVAWSNADLPTSRHALPAGHGFEFLDLSDRDREELAAAIAEALAALPPPASSPRTPPTSSIPPAPSLATRNRASAAKAASTASRSTSSSAETGALALALLDESRERAVGGFLARAFREDPIFVHVLPDPGERVRFLERFMAALARRSRMFSVAWTTAPEAVGASLWKGPDLRAMSEEQLAACGLDRIPEWLASDALARFERFFEAIDASLEADEPGPRWYLGVLGVAPEWQGRGLGSRLAAPGLERADREGLPVTLETSESKNLPLYRRLGFEVLRELGPEATGGPTVWTMRRPPHPR